MKHHLKSDESNSKAGHIYVYVCVCVYIYMMWIKGWLQRILYSVRSFGRFAFSRRGRLNANVNKWQCIQLHEHTWRFNMHVIREPLILWMDLIFPNSLPLRQTLPSGICLRLIVLWFIGWRCVSSAAPPNSQIYNYPLLLPYMNAISPASLLKRDMGHLSP